MFSLFKNLLGLFVPDSPERQLEKKIEKLIKDLRQLSPSPIDRQEDYFISGEFISYLYQSIAPFIGILSTLKGEMIEKQGVSAKRLLVESITTEEQREELAKLEEAELVDAIAKMSEEDFYADTGAILQNYVAQYNETDKEKVNLTYNRLLAFAKLGEYDFHLLFIDFDPSYKKDSLSYQPKFTAKDGKYFVEDFRKIGILLSGATLNEEFLTDLNVFLKYLGRPVPDSKKLLEAIGNLKYLVSKNIFNELVKVFSQDLNYDPEPPTYNFDIVSGQLQQIVEEKKQIIDSAYKRLKNSHVAELQTQLFGNMSAPGLAAYNHKLNEILKNYQLTPLKYVGELELIKAYLILKYNKSIKEFINNLIIRAQFKDTNAQNMLGDVYYVLNDHFDKVMAFDATVAEDGKYGTRIKTLLAMMAKDKKTGAALSTVIDDVNNLAKGLVEGMIVPLKTLMTLLEQIAQSHAEGSKKILGNIADFDGGKTAASVSRIKVFTQEMVLFFNILRNIGQSN